MGEELDATDKPHQINKSRKYYNEEDLICKNALGN